MKMTQEAINERNKFLLSLSKEARKKLEKNADEDPKYKSFVNAIFQWAVDNK